MATVGIVLVGAGAGSRLGASVPKAFVPLVGSLMIERALVGALEAPALAAVSLVVPGDRRHEADALCRPFVPASVHLSVVPGGATREDSVLAGLDALPDEVDTVLVHDAARALTPPDVFARVVAAVEALGHGIIPVLPVVDTLKVVSGGRAVATADRSELAAAQTPQGFPRDMLVDAYARAGRGETDDAGTVAAAGYPVSVVAGDPLAFKITAPADLARAEAILASAAGPRTRVGSGLDAHRFSEDAELWLAGLHWPGEPGLAGHSDGDVVCHAICDALLSAAGLGDLGSVFGTSDARYAGAHGEVFVREAVALLAASGWTVGNVSVQLVAARPRVAPRREEAERLLTQWVGAPVSFSATTTDGLGFTGAGEGALATATALVRR